MKDFIKAKKNILISIVVIIACALVLGVLITLGRDNIYAGITARKNHRGIDNSMVYQIEDVFEEGNDWVIKGIAFMTDTNSQDVDWKFKLIDMENNMNYTLRVEMVERPDVNEYYKCEYDYTRSGFIGRVSKLMVDLSQGKYQLARHIGDSSYETIVAYINDGKPTTIDPVTYPNTELPYMGSDLEKIVEDGICKVYRPDVGFYVYQLDKDLYWVADSSFNFIEDGSYIQLWANTTQTNNLPVINVENKWKISSIGDYFEKKEITGDFGNYRVGKKELPMEYSLTNMYMGCYDEGWIWGPDYFYPEVDAMVER